MYSDLAISTLKERIGFGKDTIRVEVDISNRIGTSGRLFSFFHKLVTLQNLYDTVGEIDMGEVAFNEYLDQLKEDAVKGTLVKLLDLNDAYRDDVDYSDIIITRPQVFEDVYGYTLAVSAIEQMVSTSRVNDSERNANLSYNKLKMELEGITDQDGRIMAKGIHRALASAVRRATKVIFPVHRSVYDANFW